MELVIRDFSPEELAHLRASANATVRVDADERDGSLVVVEGPMAWAMMSDPRRAKPECSAVIQHLWVDKREKLIHLWLPWARTYRPHHYTRIMVSKRLIAAVRDGEAFIFMPTDEAPTEPAG